MKIGILEAGHPPDSLRKKSRFFKKDNKLIVFTNGCFDLLHKQDYKLLDQSKIVSINAWHQDQIIQLPKDAEVIAENNFCKYAGIAYKKAALTFQGHPEYGHEFINGLVDTRGKGLVPENLLKKAKLEMKKPLTQKIIADKMAVFFKQNKLGSNVK